MHRKASLYVGCLEGGGARRVQGALVGGSGMGLGWGAPGGGEAVELWGRSPSCRGWDPGQGQRVCGAHSRRWPRVTQGEGRGGV